MKPHIHLKAKKSGLPLWRELTEEETKQLTRDIESILAERKAFKEHAPKTVKYNTPIHRCPCEIFYK